MHPGCAGCSHTPEALHMSIVQPFPSAHWCASVHGTQVGSGVSCVQVPAVQASGVQPLASSQWPSVAQGTQVGSGVVCAQLPALHASVVQWFPSLQRLPSSIWPLQSLSAPSQTSGPVELWSRALPVVAKTLTPSASATFVKSPSLQ